ncbi:g52 [Coccomyxa elongata]
MSSDDEAEQFVGDEQGLHGDSHEVADLTGGEEAPLDEEDSDNENDTGMPEESHDAHDDSVHIFEGHTGAVFAVAWSPISNLVATGGADDRVFLWQVGDETGASTAELSGHTDTVASLRFNTSGTLLASGGLDGHVGIWDMAAGSCKHSLEGPGGAIEWVDWHPRGDILLAGSEDFTAWLWNAQTAACMQVFTGHSGPVRCGRFTPDGKLVVTGGGEYDASLRVWDPKTGTCVRTMQGQQFHPTGLTALDVHADSSIVLTGAEDGSACLTNIQTGRLLGRLAGHTDSIEAVRMSSSMPYSATGSVDGNLIIWDNTSLSVRSTCMHPEAVVMLVLHPSQPLVYTACLDGVARCWDARTGTCTQQWTGHQEGIQDIAISMDGNSVITGSDDNTARVFTLG